MCKNVWDSSEDLERALEFVIVYGSSPTESSMAKLFDN